MLNIDKVREVVVMKKIKYFEKFFLLVNTIYSVKFNKNSTKKNEKKCNECYKNLSQFYPLITFNSQLISNIYRHFYPSNLYVTVKLYKVFPNGSIEDIAIQSIISSCEISQQNSFLLQQGQCILPETSKIFLKK